MAEGIWKRTVLKIKITEAKERIYTAVFAVPRGKVASYGQIARMIGLPNHARLIGAALKDLPNDSQVPWHRIVNAQGKIAFPVDSPRFSEQERRLQREGVRVVSGKIALSLFGL